MKLLSLNTLYSNGYGSCKGFGKLYLFYFLYWISIWLFPKTFTQKGEGEKVCEEEQARGECISKWSSHLSAQAVNSWWRRCKMSEQRLTRWRMTGNRFPSRFYPFCERQGWPAESCEVWVSRCRLSRSSHLISLDFCPLLSSPPLFSFLSPSVLSCPTERGW